MDEKRENGKGKRIGANKREEVWWIRGKKKKRKAKMKKWRKIRQRIEGKNMGEEEEIRRKEKGDFPGVPMVES